MGGPNAKFMKKYKLDKRRHPVHWLNAILLIFPNNNLEDVKSIDVTNDGKTKFSVKMWTAYTNRKLYLKIWGHPENLSKN